MKRFLTFIGMFLIGMLSLSGLANIAHAVEYPLPPANGRLIGNNTTYVVPEDGLPLESIAAKYQIGLLAMLEANPNVDPYLPTAGTELIIPSQMLLPDTPRQGIIINLAELRLYYYPKGANHVIVYPIGIGQLGRNTPTMTTSVSQLIGSPTWTPTANIRKDYASRGIILPAVIPPGPDNPMGDFALRLAAGRGEYLIHGTNANFGIGMRVSSGCIRLRPDDIRDLFSTVPLKTRVQVINEPIKYSVEPDGKRYVEVHQPLSKTESDDPQAMPIPRSEGLMKFIDNRETDEVLVDQAIIRRSGMPVRVNKSQIPNNKVH
ncbi:L,D-transpeptidase family protein [Xenorhabdus nematophila]|uniref:Enzyme with LysM domain n=1 Tax=Xenorhabdus nematophila (strain ATCC 19061 / DSM 3370 / CCUG 14189 / LMG 1036 / NCIMB 9965 / AN6) TaxID=406817 RepID=D3VD60_XENNA|nr:L,D-transpeptidase family protein [Xenorhabdus nematophila]CEE93142.1 putative enzyme with LysM domain [Xenorhabdus nematophila str. Anatoliense]CEF31945.1 putative enzyme with LysM domain [Xenorhabdus nematophila str. Websteri]AYA40426.1 LysM peptidoglycan-binding domain-containing protein [Xenorhabdus nematophila]KHD28528.1 peptidoglycan-binding protein [Xenorhabdus nematophila]MBA0019157.1 L,D-transpeptidase family protein [Xenorhabdus nematophila]